MRRVSLNHSFEVGEAYANRRRGYEVLSINDAADKMRVRFLDGDEEKVELTISKQHLIWQNMGADERMAARRKAEELERFARALGRDFQGLQESDFKTNVDGTHWRSRQSLGGRVSRLISEKTSLQFLSVPIYRWPVVFLSHRERAEVEAFESGAPHAKFTIEVNGQGVHYGFYVERDPERAGDRWDWHRLVKVLEHDQTLRDLVERLEADHEMLFTTRTSKSVEHYHYCNGLESGALPFWEERPGAGGALADRIRKLADLQEGWWGEIYMMLSQPKEAAIDAGEDLAGAIADFMTELLPVYETAVECDQPGES